MDEAVLEKRMEQVKASKHLLPFFQDNIQQKGRQGELKYVEKCCTNGNRTR